jgi:hypothetical protein
MLNFSLAVSGRRIYISFVVAGAAKVNHHPGSL